MAVPNLVRSLSRKDASISWFPIHNSLHVGLPKDIQMVHLNLFTPSGLVTFWANQNEIRGNHQTWGVENEPQPNTLISTGYSGSFPVPPSAPEGQLSSMQVFSSRNGLHPAAQTPLQNYFSPSNQPPNPVLENNSSFPSFHRSPLYQRRATRSQMPVPHFPANEASNTSPAQPRISLPYDYSGVASQHPVLASQVNQPLPSVGAWTSKKPSTLTPSSAPLWNTQQSPVTHPQQVEASPSGILSPPEVKTPARAATPANPRKRSHSPPKALGIVPESLPPAKPADIPSLAKELLVKLKKIDPTTYKCETFTCGGSASETSTATADDECFIVDKAEDMDDSSVESVVFNSPPASPDSPPTKKPKLDEAED